MRTTQQISSRYIEILKNWFRFVVMLFNKIKKKIGSSDLYKKKKKEIIFVCHLLVLQNHVAHVHVVQ